MNILVTGVKGQLGYDVVKEINKRNKDNVVGIDYEDLDITDKGEVDKFFKRDTFDVIIHCAAYTAVDKAEDEKELCFAVNVEGTRNLVYNAKKQNSKFIYISTDYVFDGTKDKVYEVDDFRNPISVYGESKKLGEDIVTDYNKSYVVRTSWVYGYNGSNFVKTMLRLSKTMNTLNVIDDQIGSPTYTADLAKLLCDIAESNRYGIYHGTNEDFCSWFEFAKLIFDYSNINMMVNPIPTSEYKTKATRPLNSRLNKEKLVENGFDLLPSWKDALKRYLKELGENEE